MEDPYAASRSQDSYQRGNLFPGTPLPVVLEHCIDVDAGPLRFSVEERHLVLAPRDLGDGREAMAKEDGGPSVHVYGAADGWEYLRFDLFREDPHYHYIDKVADRQMACRIDEVAEGDPETWCLTRLRERLPDMLEFAGATELGQAAHANREAVDRGIERVAELLSQIHALS